VAGLRGGGLWGLCSAVDVTVEWLEGTAMKVRSVERAGQLIGQTLSRKNTWGWGQGCYFTNCMICCTHSARLVAVHQPESARKTVTLLACVTDQQTMTSSLSDILENVKTARENALLGSYDTSQVYYQGALQQIQKHLSTVADPTRKQKWQQVRSASGI